MHVHIIVYMSRFAGAVSSDDVAAIACSAAERNARLRVTGMLLHDGHRIMQAIEGEEGTVRKLMSRIASDPRHHQLAYVHEALINNRQFDGWNMREAQLNPQRSSTRLKFQVADLLATATDAAVRAAFFGFAATAR